MARPSTVSVIISTYNEPQWLEKVIWGFSVQTIQDFELVIADDGSGQETKETISRLKGQTGLRLRHVWHEDRGYQKCMILNKAVASQKSEYLIFTDGDCIPRKDFIEMHLENAEEGYFLSGGTVRLPLELSKFITKEHIVSQTCFNKDWLLNHGLDPNFWKNLKLTRSIDLAKTLNRLTTARSTWNGGNASGWRKDIISANGFNEDLKYGGQDREFGLRMNNMGVRSKQLRFSAICLHLDHERSYKTEEAILQNLIHRKKVVRERITKIDQGLDKYL